MTRGYRPVVAIGEAQHKATAWGFDLITLGTVKKIPFDFAIEDHSRIILVRVRRLKYGQYRAEDITRACAQELGEIRGRPLPSGISCELWVRGPARAWHRYLVMPDSVAEVLTIPDLNINY